MRAKRSVVVVLPAGSLLGTTGLTSGASAALPEVTVVAKKLQGPFGIAFGPMESCTSLKAPPAR